MFFSIGYDAGYKCVLCNKFYKFDDIDKSNWKCVICGEYIRIAAPELKSGHIKIRKKAKDIQPMDGVNVADEVYSVLGITKRTDGKLSAGLKNYGALVVEEDDFVDVIDGAYYEESWDK